MKGNGSIESIALLISKDKTIAEARTMLHRLFTGDCIVSMQNGDDFYDRGYGFVLDYYSKDRNHIMKLIEDIGFLIDYDEMSDWDVME